MQTKVTSTMVTQFDTNISYLHGSDTGRYNREFAVLCRSARDSRCATVTAGNQNGRGQPHYSRRAFVSPAHFGGAHVPPIQLGMIINGWPSSERPRLDALGRRRCPGCDSAMPPSWPGVTRFYKDARILDWWASLLNSKGRSELPYQSRSRAFHLPGVIGQIELVLLWVTFGGAYYLA